MLLINHTSSSQAAKDYFEKELSQADYYMKDAQQVTGEWHGLGAAALGLHGPVDQQSYIRLCDNQHPATGEQLTVRMKANRRVTYDFTFDAPKSVTLAYELGGDTKILDAFRTSVRETMGEVEQAMAVRVRKGGAFTDRVTGNMVWAEFVHRTTRPLDDGVPDPQLHIHAVAMNTSYDAVEKCWKAGEFSAIKRDATYYQATFHARLGKRLSDLGYAVERDGKSFRLAGIGDAMTEKFSRRSQVIEEEAARRQITDAKQKSGLGRLTRKAKNADLSLSDLRKTWKQRPTADDKSALRTAEGQAKGEAVTAQQAVGHAIEHSFERESVVREKQLLAEALMRGVGSVTVADIRQEAQRGDVILQENGGERYATTKQVYREETEMVAFVREGRGTCKKLGSPQRSLDESLSREQRAAADMILSSRDRVVGLRGGAGTGKTRMMQATIAAIEQSGHRVFTFAPSAEASRGVLRNEGFAGADTVERLLRDDTLKNDVRGQVLWIDEAGLLSVRDANRLFALAREQKSRVILSGDTRQHASVSRGDALRIIEDEAGLQFAELKQVRRQTHATYREAIEAISQGDTPVLKDGKRTTKLAEGIGALEQMGAVVEVEGEARYRRIADDYLDALTERKIDGTPKSALVVAPTHAEGDHITACIRDGLNERGRLGANDRQLMSLEGAGWTTAQRKDALNYQPGLMVQFYQNAKGFKRGEKAEVVGRDKSAVKVRRADGTPATLALDDAERFQVYKPAFLGLAAGDLVRITQNGYSKETTRTGKAGKGRLNNGAVYQVTGFTREGDIRLANGFVVPKDYGHLDYGYTSTSHASQGRTVDKVFVAMGQDTLAAVNREQFYVSVSRGRESVKLYTDDKQATLDAVRASAARLSATELLKGQTPKVQPKRFSKLREMLRMERIRQNYQVLRERARDMIVPPTFRKEKNYGRSL